MPEADPIPADAPRQGSLGRAAARGMAWSAVAAVVSKLSSLGAQVALGWLLTKQDFGIFAAAMSYAALVGTLRDGGCAKLLIQRGAEYQRLARPVLGMVVVFNVLTAAALIGLGPLAVRSVGDERAAWLLAVIALSLLISGPAAVMRGRMVYQMRFGQDSRIAIASMIIRQGGMVLLAVLGFGPLSFVLPLVLVELYTYWAYRRSVGPIPAPDVSAPMSWPLVSSLLGQSKWIMLGGFATALIMNGDYLILSATTDTVLLGVYYFGYHLISSITVPFTAGIDRVIMPALSRLNQDPARQARALDSALRLLGAASGPACVVTALAVPAGVTLIWSGKWDAAIPVAQLTALSLTARMYGPLGRSAIEAKGYWRLSTILSLIDGIGLLAATAIGVYLAHDDLIFIAVCVALYQFTYSLIKTVVALRVMGLKGSRCLYGFAPALVAMVVGLLAQVLAMIFLPGRGWDDYLVSLLASALFLLLFPPLALLLFRSAYQGLLSATGLRRSSGGATNPIASE